MQETKTMNLTQWGLLVLLSVLWGGAFFFVGVAVVELPPLTVVLARVGIAAAILLGLTLFLGHSLPRTLSAWMPFLVMGLLNNAVPFSFLKRRPDHGQRRSGIDHQRHDNRCSPPW